MLVIFPVLHNISLQLIYFIHSCLYLLIPYHYLALSWSVPLYHLVYCWFLPVYFFISIIVFFISVWLFYILSKSLLKTSNFLVWHTFFSWVLWSSLWLSPWTLSWVECLSPLHLVLLLEFYLVSLFWAWSSVISFCLIFCFYFCVFGRLVMFSNLEDVAFCRRCVCISASHSLLATRAICSRGAPSVYCVGPSVVAGWLLWVVWYVWLAPGLLGCQALPCLEAASHWFMGSGHEATGCWTPRGLGTSPGSLVSGVRFQEI